MTDARKFFKEMRIVEFNRREDEWLRWSKKFLAIVKVKKFVNIIDGLVTVPSLSNNMEVEDIAFREMKQVAYCCLLHCMNDDICFNLVDTAKTETYQMKMQHWRGRTC